MTLMSSGPYLSGTPPLVTLAYHSGMSEKRCLRILRWPHKKRSKISFQYRQGNDSPRRGGEKIRGFFILLRNDLMVITAHLVGRKLLQTDFTPPMAAHKIMLLQLMGCIHCRANTKGMAGVKINHSL
ncbi:hypothetical protein PUG81_27120 [Erwiniaceae bacterium L1_54_6]|nr:hypothetical protein [Erwiniaceae bacterium L1_54_6]